jgi:hypothetical protein
LIPVIVGVVLCQSIAEHATGYAGGRIVYRAIHVVIVIRGIAGCPVFVDKLVNQHLIGVFDRHRFAIGIGHRGRQVSKVICP